MNDEQKSFLVDMLKSEGWKIYESLSQEQIINLRVMATQPDVPNDKRLWYAAEAKGREDALLDIKTRVE